MSFGHALYYPYIHLLNKNWLKYAFLFWDKISRIVPSSVSPSDSEDIIKLRYETNFIDDYSPDQWVVSDTFNYFSDLLNDFIESSRFYMHFRKNRHLDDWKKEYHYRRKFNDDPDFRRGYLQAVTQSQGTYLHVQKLDSRLKEKFFDIGLAIPGENEWEDWIKIDNEIGFMYMTCLARVISKEKTLPIVTDVDHYYSAASFLKWNMYQNYNAEFEYKLGHLLIASFLPKDINTVPFDKLIEIREKYSTERIAFFNTIANLCQNIPSIKNKSALKDALHHYGDSLIDQTVQLKSAFEANKIETVTKFMSISVPSALVSLSSFIPIDYKPLGIGAGLLFGLASSINSTKKEINKLRRQPLSYLLSIKSELSGDHLLRRIIDGAKGIRRW